MVIDLTRKTRNRAILLFKWPLSRKVGCVLFFQIVCQKNVIGRLGFEPACCAEIYYCTDCARAAAKVLYFDLVKGFV